MLDTALIPEQVYHHTDLVRMRKQFQSWTFEIRLVTNDWLQLMGNTILIVMKAISYNWLQNKDYSLTEGPKIGIYIS